MRTILRRYFEMANCEVLEAGSVDEALAVIKCSEAPLLVTLDLNLGDGGEALTLERIAELKAACPDAVVIVLTGAVDVSATSRVLEAGAHAMLLKQNDVTGGFFERLTRKLKELVSGVSPNTLNLAVAEALAHRFASYVKQQDVPKPT